MPKTRVHVNFNNIGGMVNNRSEVSTTPNRLTYGKNIYFDKLGSVTNRPIMRLVTETLSGEYADYIEYVSSDGVIRAGEMDFT